MSKKIERVWIHKDGLSCFDEPTINGSMTLVMNEKLNSNWIEFRRVVKRKKKKEGKNGG